MRSFTLAPGRFSELADALRAEPFDGSSNFDDLPIPADVDTTLMVTDGLMTDGKADSLHPHGAGDGDQRRRLRRHGAAGPAGRPHRRRAGGRRAAIAARKRAGHADARLAHREAVQPVARGNS